MGSKVKKYSVLFCVGIVACCFMGFILRIVVQKSFEGKKISETPFRAVFMDKDENFFMKVKNRMDKKQETKDVDIDWQKLYPFKQVVSGQNGIQLEVKKKTKLELLSASINERKGRMNSKLETHIENYLFCYDQFVDFSRKYEDIIGKNIQYVPINGVYKLPDGYMTFVYEKCDVRDKVESVVGLQEYCKGKGIDFAYLCAPFKVCEKDVTCYGVKDFSNHNADDLLKGLGEKGILYLDLREQIKKQGLKHHSLFFRTDHHWLPETAVWAAGEVGLFLNNVFKYNIDITKYDIDRFRVVTYEKWFLGSQGCKVKLQYATPDDINLLYTKEPVSIKVQVPSRGVYAEGDLSVLYAMNEIEPLDYYGSDPYSAYGQGDQPLIRIHNNGQVENKKVLLIKDSFGASFAHFFCLGVRDMTIVDLRYFPGSLQSVIEEEKPDTVLIMYNPNQFNEIINYTNHKSLWDFR